MHLPVYVLLEARSRFPDIFEATGWTADAVKARAHLGPVRNAVVICERDGACRTVHATEGFDAATGAS
jgi:hypothetical protein